MPLSPPPTGAETAQEDAEVKLEPTAPPAKLSTKAIQDAVLSAGITALRSTRDRF